MRGQLLRAGTGVASNYRAACRGKSKADFIAKLGTVIEEADESEFWLELIGRAELMTVDATRPLRSEANELIAIFTPVPEDRTSASVSDFQTSFLLPLLQHSALSIQH